MFVSTSQDGPHRALTSLFALSHLLAFLLLPAQTKLISFSSSAVATSWNVQMKRRVLCAPYNCRERSNFLISFCDDD